MGCLLRLASWNWSGFRRRNSTPPGSLIARSAVSASNCTTISFPRLTGPTYILPWCSPILPRRSTRLEALALSVAWPAGPRETAAERGVRAAKIINHYNMSKQFCLTISDGHLAWARQVDAIQ